MIKNSLLAVAAMMGMTAGGAVSYNPARRADNVLDDYRKYSPRAMNKGRSGDKLRRKAREGKLGMATLR